MKENINKRVLVTSGWLRSTCAIARNLARNGLEVHVGDFQDVCMSSVSKFVTGSFKYPPHRSEPEAFVETVSRYINENKIGTYIPSHEEGFVVAQFIDRFPDSVKIPVASYEQIMAFHMKDRMTELAAHAQVPTPRSTNISSLDESPGIEFPLIAKAPDSNGAHGVRICRTESDLKKAWQELKTGSDTKDPLVVQEYLEGKKIYAASLLANHGEVVASFVRRNLREKEPFGGACVRCESVKYPEIVDGASRLVQQTGFHGFAMFEFLVDENESPKSEWDFWLMDINPRYWGTSSHAIDCGVEFPHLQYCMANELPFEKHPDYPIGKTSRWIAGDVISFVKRNNASSDDPRDIVRQYMDLDDDFFMDLKNDDPKPFVMQSLLYYLHRDKIFKD